MQFNKLIDVDHGFVVREATGHMCGLQFHDPTDVLGPGLSEEFSAGHDIGRADILKGLSSFPEC